APALTKPTSNRIVCIARPKVNLVAITDKTFDMKKEGTIMTPDKKSHEKIENLELKMTDIAKAVNLLAIELDVAKRELFSIRAKNSAMQAMIDVLWAKTKPDSRIDPHREVNASSHGSPNITININH
ncbi:MULTISPECIES: hypothetical protein, partial [unclassified Microcoleus]|uniref:hypothetical protein n=1 Tax=unclassified Microcoleus TaxID=2642155 RepID=UPI002FD2F2E3